MEHCTDEQFFAILTSKRDESLAHLTDMIRRSGFDEFCHFLTANLTPMMGDGTGFRGDPHKATQVVVAHMAIVGAVDAMLSYRDAMIDEE